MFEAYYIGKFMVVPVDGFDLLAWRDIFRQLHQVNQQRFVKVEFHNTLTKALPDFLDSSVVHNWSEKPSFFGEGAETHTDDIMYTVPLEKGRVSARMTLAKDLRTCIRKTDFDSLSDERKCSLLDVISGRSGIIVHGQYQLGTDYNQGLYVGVDFEDLGKSKRGRIDNIPDSITEAVMHALCTSTPLQLHEDQRRYSPLSFCSREIRANMKDLRVEKLKEAEPHINEFFNWISSNAEEIQTVLVMGNLHRSFAHWESQLQELQDSKKINLKQRPTYAAQTFEIITGMMNDLHPPKNKRMDYLVSS